MFGMSAERNEVERPARIDTGGTPALRSLCTRKKTLLPAIVIYCIRTFRLPAPGVPEMIVTHGGYIYNTSLSKPHLLIKYRPRVTNVRYECRAERSGATGANCPVRARTANCPVRAPAGSTLGVHAPEALRGASAALSLCGIALKLRSS